MTKEKGYLHELRDVRLERVVGTTTSTGSVSMVTGQVVGGRSRR